MALIPPRWPDVYAALLAKLPTLDAFSGVEVFDGLPLTGEDPDNWVSIGFVTDEGAGAFQQSPDPSGFATTEVGDIRCHLASNVRDSGDLAATRRTVFALFAAWQEWLFADQTMGGALPTGSVIDLSAQVQAHQDGNAGSASGLIVTVTYQVTTYIS